MSEKAAEMKPYTYEDIQEIANFLKKQIKIAPKIGVICGTGLGAAVSLITDPIAIDYKDIPKFPVSTVQGHHGRLIFGHAGPIPVVFMQGRFHLFEGYPLWKVVLPIRVMKLLGVETLILSNAAGGINQSYKVGSLMLLKDHINLVNFGGQNPLQGFNDERWGPRFVAMNNCYDKTILNLAKNLVKELKIKDVEEGVYACLGGPCFETVAELKALQTLGADAVGMSTVHEVTAARHCGIRCFAFSLITNRCILDYDSCEKPSHEEILTVGSDKEKEVKRFLERLLQEIGNLV